MLLDKEGSMDSVRNMYEKFPYPQPRDDIEQIQNKKIHHIGFPENYFYRYWPEFKYTEELDILVAGCGTSEAVEYAAANPRSRVVGVDLSQSSLEMSQALAKKHNITNLRLEHSNICDAQSLNRDFDLIVSTGAIHHLEEPSLGLKSLASVLKPHGSMKIMLYGKYGRDAIYYVQSLLKDLGFSAWDIDSVRLGEIRSIISKLPTTHPLHHRKNLFSDLTADYDAVLLDYFLHPIDRAYSIKDINHLLSECGLQFQHLFARAHFISNYKAAASCIRSSQVKKLSEIEKYQIGELFDASAIRHDIVICRGDRDLGKHISTLSNDQFFSLVPHKLPNCSFSSLQLKEKEVLNITARFEIGTLNYRLPIEQSAIFNAIDGKRSLSEIRKLLTIKGTDQEVIVFLRRLFLGYFDKEIVVFEPAAECAKTLNVS